MAPPKVSFALICYEQEEFVRDAVRAALAQDYEPLEIVLSDDCSPDGTFDIIEEELAKYDGPHTLSINRNPTNLGSEHLDKVMTLVRGDFVVVAHGDDISMPHRTRRTVDAWIKHDVSLISSNAAIIDAEARPLGLLCNVDEDREIPVEEIIDRGWNKTMLGATFSYHRDVFTRFEPLDRRALAAGIDHIFPFRAALLKGMYYLSEPLVRWRRHGRNLTDAVGDKTSTELVWFETNAAYAVTAMIYVLEDLERFRKGRPQDARLAAVQKRFVRRILRSTREWSRYRNALILDGQRPTWVDKAELEAKPAKDVFRLRPDLPEAGPRDGGEDGT
jgi:glycosyltransferase involved in cell wall biosynthesis